MAPREPDQDWGRVLRMAAQHPPRAQRALGVWALSLGWCRRLPLPGTHGNLVGLGGKGAPKAPSPGRAQAVRPPHPAPPHREAPPHQRAGGGRPVGVAGAGGAPWSPGPGLSPPPQVYQEEETISLQNAFSVVELKPSVAPVPEPSPGGGPDQPLLPHWPLHPTPQLPPLHGQTQPGTSRKPGQQV